MATRIGRILRNFGWCAGLAFGLALTATGAQAAPYAAYVMDARTGEVLYQKNADARLHPASLTKMLTLYICFDAIERGELSLDTVVTISRNAAKEPPSHLGLRPGQKIKLRYLIRAAAVKSANDAAWAIGDAVSGNMATFVKRMNATAKKLGMDDSHFENPNGLTLKGHLSSAHDMAIIGRHLFYDFPQFYNIFSRRSTYAGVAEVYSTNRKFLDAYKGADGIKTGYTYASGFNLVASAERGGKRIIAAEFGGTSTAERNAKMADLLDIGFKRAPAHVALQKPKKPNLDRIAALYSAHPQATQIALADDTGSTRVDSSPRPERRPGDAPAPSAALMAAIQDNVSSALNRVADGAAPAADAQAAPLNASVKPVRRPGAAPVQVAANNIPIERADPMADRTDIGANGSPDLPPPPRPSDLVATAQPKIATSTAAARASAAVDAAARSGAPAGSGALTVASAATAPIEQVEPTAADAAAPAEAAAASASAQDADSGVVYASVAPRQVPAPEARPEVVTRMSTSGGRNWGINVGRFPSAFTAEKALLHTALAESSALSGGARKVVRRPNGFDANFMGLTQDQADLACSRLQARGIQCFSLAP